MIWQSKQVLKSNPLHKLNRLTGRRPKGLKDEEWTDMRKEHLLNRQIMMDKVPKGYVSGDKNKGVN